jgi:hypothetical protein
MLQKLESDDTSVELSASAAQAPKPIPRKSAESDGTQLGLS